MDQKIFSFSGFTLVYYEEIASDEYRAQIRWSPSDRISSWDEWWRSLDDRCLPFSCRKEPEMRHFGIVEVKAPRIWNGKEHLERRLPWKCMRDREILEKFFGMGNWPYMNESITIPRSFAFKSKPTSIFKESDINCDRHIMSFLNVYDYLALSTCSKANLALARSNETIKMLSGIKRGGMPYFAKAGMKARKKIRSAPGGCQADLKQYEYWWYCSTAKIVNLLWHRWEDFSQDEKDTQWAVRRNRAMWYEEENSTDSDVGEAMFRLELEDECDY